MEKIINVKDLTKVYEVPIKQGFWKSIFVSKNKELVAVNKVGFGIEVGESVALLGPNGAGKTTTLKMLTGLLYPTSGDIEVLGYTPTDRKREFLSQIALVMGNKTGLSWDLSARQSFTLFKTIYQIPENIFEKRLTELTELLDATEYLDTPVRKLSLGQRLKMELVGAILHRPSLLFLDEPTIGLDVVSKRKIRNFLRYLHREEKTTIILTSHEMADIEMVSDRVIVINNGQIVFDNSLEKLLHNYQDKKYLTVTFTKPVAIDKLSKLGNIIDSKELTATLEIPREKQGKVMARLTEKFPVDDIDVRSIPLDEIMEDLFAKTR
ncbi:MAG: ABC transporter related protein [Candidatus Collierbacteria bacterium GW2011_GWB1_44_6]|uniref:ABC transporter related protein n=2 Tax=Candidatus Collieribacteriota TaxID=1752725 RepID=A0A0G1LUS3_9BACT|nr:MAG: ABC transporter related protein [Candidatus Collierbacteria bacterium GW2011_GWC2_43_12]KKT72557.1 MAG: ABC transporter related protein [Candidatus Collierbacteria bacterium GW2011_GWB1_44_6]KKT82826.1 MAG: ABC transporter related protein, ABC-2 type transport system ATP-binding protein [Microgenomates group bacterium GW2011_GWC1_44_9]